MALDIAGAAVGYDAKGIQEFINKLNIEMIDDLVKQIHDAQSPINAAVDNVWQGRAANAFKEKFDRDGQTMIETLNIIKGDVESNLYQIGKNLDNFDEGIAEQINNAE